MSVPQIQIKQEPTDANDLESRILDLCKSIPEGITDEVIQNGNPDVDAKQRVMAINRLLSTGKIDLLKSGNKLIYRIKSTDANSRNKGTGSQEKLIYQIIEEAGNKGIWIRNIRYKSNLLLTEVNKVLKSLESKKIVKAIKSVSETRRKVYMLYNLEPDRSVTGGAWYSDQEFESEFVDILNQQCLKLLLNKLDESKSELDLFVQRNSAYVTSEEACDYIKDLGISKVQLDADDIETILTTLIYDGKAETISKEVAHPTRGKVLVNLYRAVKPLIDVSPLMRTPCGICPVFKECHIGGEVSPQTCEYFTEWFKS